MAIEALIVGGRDINQSLANIDGEWIPVIESEYFPHIGEWVWVYRGENPCVLGPVLMPMNGIRTRYAG